MRDAPSCSGCSRSASCAGYAESVTRPVPLWPGPVEAGARAIATRHLDAAAGALARLAGGADAEALHDFRVALRRLRSALRAYLGHLDPEVTPTALEQAGALASRTGRARDAEVQIEWLRTQLAGRNAARSAAAQHLIQRLEALVARARRAGSGGLARDFAELESALRPALATYSAPVSGIGPLPGRSFGEVSAELLRAALDELFASLGRVHGEQDEEPAHRARIEAKRLRYLLEPFAREVRGVSSILRRMRRLQDLLGDLNDLRVLRASLARALEQAALAGVQRRLAEVDAGNRAGQARAADRALEAGLLSLAGRVQARRRSLFARFAGRWLGESATERAGLAAEVGALAERLAKRKSVL
jgi:CHAD domain-containing protein